MDDTSAAAKLSKDHAVDSYGSIDLLNTLLWVFKIHLDFIKRNIEDYYTFK